MKICSKCGLNKRKNKFYTRPDRISGLMSWCIPCLSKSRSDNFNHARAREYQKMRRKKDPIFKIKCILRERLNKAIKGDYKSGSAVKSLGCSVEEFKKYLQSLFKPGMNWSNHGKGRNKWQIDHVKPLSSFDLTHKKQLSKACHFKNLQPLWYGDHLVKTKRDKKIYG